MAQHKSRAFIVSSVDYRETSKLIHILCEQEGRISLIGRGLRAPKSRKTPATAPFTLAQITYNMKEGETLGLLTGIEPERMFTGIRTSLESYALASYWFEIVRTAAQPRLASPEFFELTESFFNSLDNPRGLSDFTVWHFGRLLQALGFGAGFHECAVCGKSDLLEHFDASVGSTICARCALPRRRYLPVNCGGHGQVAAALFSEAQPRQPAPLAGEQMLPFFLILHELLTMHLEQPLRSFRFVTDVLSSAGPVSRGRQ